MVNTDLSHIQGWGADLDHANRPAYPKERIPAREIGVHWDHPEHQVPTVEILKSIEHQRMPAIFGTTNPPRGLSGWMRRYAFTFSEGKFRHWMILLLADRVNMIEGIGADILLRGYIPNILAEMGIRAEWKYNKKGLLMKALGVATVGVCLGLLVAHARARKVEA